MSDPTRPKLSEALKGQQPEAGAPVEHHQTPHPEQAPEEFDPAQARQHNREVNAGVHSNKDRMVDIGRGENTAGRQH